MNSRNKKLTGAGMISLAIFVVWGFAVPAHEEIKQLGAGVDEMKNILESRANIFSTIDKLKTDYISKNKEIEKISIIIPPKKRVPELISTMESLASRNGLILSSLNITDGETKDAAAIVNMEATLYGSYEAFRSFLAALEKNRRLIEVGVVKLSLDQGTLQIQVSGYAHVLSLAKNNNQNND